MIKRPISRLGSLAPIMVGSLLSVMLRKLGGEVAGIEEGAMRGGGYVVKGIFESQTFRSSERITK